MGKFNEYAEKSTPDDVDIFLLQDTSATKKITFLSIFNQIKTKLGLGLLATKSKISEEELETALLNLINGKLTASGLSNDLITTDATKALAAPQGKKLLEYIGTLTQLTTVEKANLVGAINELVTSVDSLNRNIENKIIIGSTKDAMMLITESSMAFSEGTATLNASSIATTYGKTISNAIVHFKSAGGTVITSTTVANNVVTARARNIEINAPYGGTIPCVIYLFLK